MENLEFYASIAEIFGALTIVLGAGFAYVQFNEYRKRRQNQVAAELCRKFAEPDMARAVTLLRQLPDDISLKELQAMDPEYEDAAQIIGMAFETMGLMVYKEIASFEMVQQLAGGLLQSMWRKIRTWITESRDDIGNPRFGEWMEWIADRLSEHEASVTPAFIAHADWKVKG